MSVQITSAPNCDASGCRVAHRCHYCGSPLFPCTVVWDHFVPRVSGGCDGVNLVPSCHWCNNIKATGSIERFRNVCRLYTVYLDPETKLPIREKWYKISEELFRQMEDDGATFPHLLPPGSVVFYFEVPKEQRKEFQFLPGRALPRQVRECPGL